MQECLYINKEVSVYISKIILLCHCLRLSVCPTIAICMLQVSASVLPDLGLLVVWSVLHFSKCSQTCYRGRLSTTIIIARAYGGGFQGFQETPLDFTQYLNH